MKTNITLRVDKELVDKLREEKINLSKFFNDAARILIFKEEAFLNIGTDKIEFVTPVVQSTHNLNSTSEKEWHYTITLQHLYI